MAIEFNSTGGGLVRTTDLPGATWTLLGWIKLVSLATAGWRGLLTFASAGGSNYAGIWRNQTNTTELDLLADGDASEDAGFATITQNEWFGAAITIDGTGADALRAYVLDIDTLGFATAVADLGTFTKAAVYIGDSPFDEVGLGDGAYFKAWDGVALSQDALLKELLHIRPVTNLSSLYSWSPAFGAGDAVGGDLRDRSGRGRHWDTTQGALQDIDGTSGTNMPRRVSWGVPALRKRSVTTTTTVSGSITAPVADVAASIDIETELSAALTAPGAGVAGTVDAAVDVSASLEAPIGAVAGSVVNGLEVSGALVGVVAELAAQIVGPEAVPRGLADPGSRSTGGAVSRATRHQRPRGSQREPFDLGYFRWKYGERPADANEEALDSPLDTSAELHAGSAGADVPSSNVLGETAAAIDRDIEQLAAIVETLRATSWPRTADVERQAEAEALLERAELAKRRLQQQRAAAIAAVQFYF